VGSTDFGNVSQVVPAVLFSLPTWPRGTSFHTREAARLAGEPQAFAAMLEAGRVMAAAAAELACSPALLEAARAALAG
jgi:aminobenzoyl-glutamate utilization protein B